MPVTKMMPVRKSSGGFSAPYAFPHCVLQALISTLVPFHVPPSGHGLPPRPPRVWTQPPWRWSAKALQDSYLHSGSLWTCRPQPPLPPSQISNQLQGPEQAAILPQRHPHPSYTSSCIRRALSSRCSCPVGSRAETPGRTSGRPHHRNRPWTALCLKRNLFNFLYSSFFIYYIGWYVSRWLQK